MNVSLGVFLWVCVGFKLLGVSLFLVCFLSMRKAVPAFATFENQPAEPIDVPGTVISVFGFVSSNLFVYFY